MGGTGLDLGSVGIIMRLHYAQGIEDSGKEKCRVSLCYKGV